MLTEDDEKRMTREEGEELVRIRGDLVPAFCSSSVTDTLHSMNSRAADVDSICDARDTERDAEEEGKEKQYS